MQRIIKSIFEEETYFLLLNKIKINKIWKNQTEKFFMALKISFFRDVFREYLRPRIVNPRSKFVCGPNFWCLTTWTYQKVISLTF